MRPNRQWDIEQLDERVDGVAEVAPTRRRHYAASIASGILIAGLVAGFGPMGALRTQSFANKGNYLLD
ncbi:MAG: hypothetical protein ABSG13_28425 [Bryobacteraceae bacterium]